MSDDEYRRLLASYAVLRHAILVTVAVVAACVLLTGWALFHLVEVRADVRAVREWQDTRVVVLAGKTPRVPAPAWQPAQRLA